MAPEAANSRVIERFNNGLVGVDDVLKATTAAIRKNTNNWQAAKACLDALQQCRHPVTREAVTPDVIVFNALISACERTGRVDDALRMFADLEQGRLARGVFPNTITYNAVISACEKAERADDALRMFARLEENGPARGVFPNTITYNAVISACEKADRQDAVSELLDKAIAGKVFKASLGFDAKLNKLDLHEGTVATVRTGTGREGGISSPTAKAIFRRLSNEGVINDKTEIVVGHRGSGALKDALAQCMRDQGWVPVHPLGLSGMPNPGALVGSSAASVARPRDGHGSRPGTSRR